MTNETAKTNIIREHDFAERFLQGKVIDIGAGDDLVCEHAERFDVQEGDANNILKYRKPNSCDTVHSSHCLEHMHNPPEALKQWWQLIKNGEYLVLVVPDEDLYEQGIWPSRFNNDHKATFRLKNPESWSPVSHDIWSLVNGLDGAKIIEAERQDANYNYSLMVRHGEKISNPNWLTKKLTRKARRIENPIRRAKRLNTADRFTRFFNIPIDQTSRDALAQIQIVAQKSVV